MEILKESVVCEEYEGDFKDGAPHGKGVWHGDDGSIFTGEFRYGRSSGKGVYTHQDGPAKTEGQFLGMRPHGKVKHVTGLTSGLLGFEGEFIHGIGHGEILLKIRQSESGTGDIIRVRGSYRMGRPHGTMQVVEGDGRAIRRMKFVRGVPKIFPEDMDESLMEVMKTKIEL